MDKVRNEKVRSIAGIEREMTYRWIREYCDGLDMVEIGVVP